MGMRKGAHKNRRQTDKIEEGDGEGGRREVYEEVLGMYSTKLCYILCEYTTKNLFRHIIIMH